MAKFPDPVKPPPSVQQARRKRSKELTRSITFGINIRIVIAVAELIGWAWFESSALLLDALATSIDIAATLVLYFSIKFAARPPDKNHPFGHGRFEPLAGLQLGILLVLVGVFTLVQQAFDFGKHPEQQPLNPFVWLIPFAAVILLEICYRYMMRTAKANNSPALAADAVHFRVDALNSLIAALALSVSFFYPAASRAFDNFGAMGISLFMIILGFNGARSNFHQIVDRTPEKLYFDKVRRIVSKVDGVLGSEKLQIQMSGPDAHINIDIEVDPKMSVEKAHEITQQVRAEIQKGWPAVRDVIVHVEPYYPNDHHNKHY